VDIPESLADITEGWLQAALAECAGLETAVEHVESTVIATGEGFMGSLARLAITYASAPPDAPTGLVAKLPTQDPGGQAIGSMMRVWEREHRFYDEVAPTLDVRTPRAYVNLADAEAGRFALLLEDLAPLRSVDQVVGATPGQAERVMRELASLHSAWFEHPSLAALSWMPRVDDPMSAAIVPLFEMGWAAFRERYGERVPSRVLGWAEQFVGTIPSLLEQYATDPVTICHGDARLDNMFFDDTEDAFAVVDWQLAMRAPGGADLVYFLISNLDPPVRRENERHLVDEYLTALYAGGVPESAYSPEAAWLGYREGALFWSVALATNLVTLDPGNERGQRLLDTLVERVYTAADDLDAGEIIGRG
jgi:hypothetical protein